MPSALHKLARREQFSWLIFTTVCYWLLYFFMGFILWEHGFKSVMCIKCFLTEMFHLSNNELDAMTTSVWTLTYLATSSLPSTDTCAFVDIHTSALILTGRSTQSYKTHTRIEKEVGQFRKIILGGSIVVQSAGFRFPSCFFCFSIMV